MTPPLARPLRILMTTLAQLGKVLSRVSARSERERDRPCPVHHCLHRRHAARLICAVFPPAVSQSRRSARRCARGGARARARRPPAFAACPFDDAHAVDSGLPLASDLSVRNAVLVEVSIARGRRSSDGRLDVLRPLRQQAVSGRCGCRRIVPARPDADGHRRSVSCRADARGRRRGRGHSSCVSARAHRRRTDSSQSA